MKNPATHLHPNRRTGQRPATTLLRRRLRTGAAAASGAIAAAAFALCPAAGATDALGLAVEASAQVRGDSVAFASTRLGLIADLAKAGRFDEAAQLARGLRGFSLGEAHVLLARAFVTRDGGASERFQTAISNAGAVAAGLGHARQGQRLRTQIAETMVLVGEDAEASLAVSQLSKPDMVCTAEARLAIAKLARGDWPVEVPFAEDAASKGAASGFFPALVEKATAFATLARAELARGESPPAPATAAAVRDHLRDAERAARLAGVDPSPALAAIAAVYRDLGDTGAERRTIAWMEHIVGVTGDAATWKTDRLLALALLHSESGREGEAREHLGKARSHASSLPAHERASALCRVAGASWTLGDHDGATTAWQDSVEAARSCPNPRIAAQNRVDVLRGISRCGVDPGASGPLDGLLESVAP